MRFDKATDLLARIHDGKVSSRKDAGRLMHKDPITIWRWVRELTKHGVVIDQDRKPWRVKSYGGFKKPLAKGK